MKAFSFQGEGMATCPSRELLPHPCDIVLVDSASLQAPSCYFQEPRNQERFLPLGTCLHFLSSQGLFSLDVCLLASHSCFANSAICFLPLTRKKPGHDFRRPPQVPASVWGLCFVLSLASITRMLGDSDFRQSDNVR